MWQAAVGRTNDWAGTVAGQQARRFAEPGIGNEATDASQEWEAGAFDGGLHPGFDQGEGRERIARDQTFVTELNETVGDVCGIESEVFGIEPLATAPVTDGGCDEDAPAADAVEELGVLGTVIGIHGGWIWGLVLMGGRNTWFLSTSYDAELVVISPSSTASPAIRFC